MLNNLILSHSINLEAFINGFSLPMFSSFFDEKRLQKDIEIIINNFLIQLQFFDFVPHAFDFFVLSFSLYESSFFSVFKFNLIKNEVAYVDHFLFIHLINIIFDHLFGLHDLNFAI